MDNSVDFYLYIYNLLKSLKKITLKTVLVYYNRWKLSTRKI